MYKNFQQFILANRLFTPSGRLLLAVSGGVDSIVLFHLALRLKVPFAVAHCNYGLRGEESDGDEQFVRKLAEKHKVPFFSKRWDTASFARKKKISVQMAARELRYQWFEEWCVKEGYDHIVTAHHHDDAIETWLINLVKGTGIAGLHGILPRQGRVIRPLLFASRKDIESYAKRYRLAYREDSSNASDKYFRNKLRHKVIPVLKELNPSLEKTIAENIDRIKQVEEVLDIFMKERHARLLQKEKGQLRINAEDLKKEHSLVAYELLKTYGFTPSQIKSSLKTGQPGKKFYSPSHLLLKDRTGLIVTERRTAKTGKGWEAGRQVKRLQAGQYELRFQTLPVSAFKPVPDNAVAFLNEERIKWPLTVRPWKKGDRFVPLGMKQSKKLSDFFIDLKVPLHQKEEVLVLESGGEIVWVAGYRISDRFKVTGATTRVLRVDLSPL